MLYSWVPSHRTIPILYGTHSLISDRTILGELQTISLRLQAKRAAGDSAPIDQHMHHSMQHSTPFASTAPPPHPAPQPSATYTQSVLSASVSGAVTSTAPVGGSGAGRMGPAAVSAAGSTVGASSVSGCATLHSVYYVFYQSFSAVNRVTEAPLLRGRSNSKHDTTCACLLGLRRLILENVVGLVQFLQQYNTRCCYGIRSWCSPARDRPQRGSATSPVITIVSLTDIDILICWV